MSWKYRHRPGHKPEPSSAHNDALEITWTIDDPIVFKEPHTQKEIFVRTERWRYIQYADGAEELYDHHHDPHEWTNLAAQPEHRETLAAHRR